MATREPAYCRQKRSSGKDFAYVEVDGRRHYLGPFGTDESRVTYHRLLMEWRANGGTLPEKDAALTVVELVAKFWDWADAYYRTAEGNVAGESDNYRHSLRPVRELYGHMPAASFGPKALRAIQQHLIAKGATRYRVNMCTYRIKRMFKWAVSMEILPPAVYQALATVDGVRRGRTAARETDPVRPVLRAHVDAVLPHLSRQVSAMIELQWITGARPGELVILRPRDIDMTGEVWIYRPESHKTAHHGHERLIYFGPQAQGLLRPFLESRPPWSYCFSPQEAEEERRRQIHEQRVTPLSCGNTPGSNRVLQPEREPGDHYTTHTYRRAIHRACTTAKIPPWGPHRLRHSAATNFRREFGLDAASILLGHRCPSITTIYAEADQEKAIEIARKIG